MMLAALRERNAERASTIMYEHIHQAGTLLVAHFERGHQ
jgi:DNA-binding GntR family transcriptional regulator